jgi:hypothetical protein
VNLSTDDYSSTYFAWGYFQYISFGVLNAEASVGLPYNPYISAKFLRCEISSIVNDRLVKKLPLTGYLTFFVVKLPVAK